MPFDSGDQDQLTITWGLNGSCYTNTHATSDAHPSLRATWTASDTPLSAEDFQSPSPTWGMVAPVFNVRTFDIFNIKVDCAIQPTMFSQPRHIQILTCKWMVVAWRLVIQQFHKTNQVFIVFKRSPSTPNTKKARCCPRSM